MTTQNKAIQKLLEHLPENFEILETGIDLQTQKEYLECSISFGRGTLSDEETLRLSNYLFQSGMNLGAKKKALCLLAHLGTAEAFRNIKKYCKHPDNALRSWASLALQECKMFLEGNLTETNTGFISTGLGGAENKLRYYTLVLPFKKTSFTKTQQKLISDEFSIVCLKENSKLETADLNDNYVGITTLIPIDVAPSSIFETAIFNCNQTGEFVMDHYFSTNVRIPNENEINEIINIIKNHE